MQRLLSLAIDRLPTLGLSGAVMGIDASLTGMATVVWATGQKTHEVWRTSAKAESIRARDARYVGLIKPTIELARKHQPAIVLIEKHPFSRHQGKAFDRAELRGVLHRALIHVCPARTVIGEVMPNTLKRFAASKGNATKGGVQGGLALVFGRVFANDDIADAYALVRLGMCCAGISRPETKEQLEVMCDVVAKLRKEAA